MRIKRNFITKSHFLLIVALFLLASTSINFTTGKTNYYISESGVDSANGQTSNTPWLTIAKINKTNAC